MGKNRYDLSHENGQQTASDYSSKDTVANVGRSTDELVKDDEEERGHWGNRAEFLLSCIGLSVGLGNVWRFPVLAFENGGAAFLIPYIILQLVIGKPMYFMELAMGQFSGLGPTAVWRMNPAAKGIGVSMLLISLMVAIYYNVVMAYTLYFFFASMQETLPWTKCDDKWTGQNCTVLTGSSTGMQICSDVLTNETCRCNLKTAEYSFNTTSPCFDFSYNNFTYYKELATNNATVCGENFMTCSNTYRTAASIYYYDDVIQMSSSIEDIGTPIWYLALCLLLSWIVVVLCLIKGVKSSGKVVYFTATFPYLILIVLLIGGAIQEGSLEGVLFFLNPKWHQLLDINVWRAAAGQMFFSLSVSFGGIIMFGSYNKFKNNVYVDALIISMMDIITSFIAGLTVFTTLGAMSYETGIPIEDVAKKGFGFAFVAYPEALARLPVPHLFSILFFFMLFTLGLDSEFALLETILTCAQDEFPKLRKYKWQLCICSGIVLYFIALPIVCPGGIYIIDLLDTYGATFSVLLVALFELISVAWVYRVDRFLKDVKYMLGYYPHPHFYWIACWAIIAPVLIGAIFVLSMYFYKVPSYSEDKPWEDWAIGICWLIFAIVFIPMPIGVVIAIAKQEGSFSQKVVKAFTPTADWGPQKHEDNTWRRHHFPGDKDMGIEVPLSNVAQPPPYTPYSNDNKGYDTEQGE